MKILVVAHPDDEIIWFNPKGFDKIIICFLDRLDNFAMFLMRKKVLAKHPLKDKIKCLRLTESGYYNDKTQLKEYKANEISLRELLPKELEGATEIYTHNPETGEYGHSNHILVGQVVKELAQCPVYVLDMLANEKTANRIAVEPDLNFYLQTRQLYQDYQCWTWFGDFYPRSTLYYRQL